MCGVGLRLKEQKGLRSAPPTLPLASEGRGPHLGAQHTPWARVGRESVLCSSGPGGPPHLLSLPPMPLGPMRPGGGFGGQGTWLGAQQPSRTQVGRANTLHSSPAPPILEGPSHLPVLFSPGFPLMAPGPTWPGGDL